MGMLTSAAQIAGEVGQTWFQHRQNKRMQDRAFRQQKHMAQNAYQYAKADLEKAGLNPMLAYMSGTNVGSPGGTPSGGSSGSAAKSINSAAIVQQQLKNMRAQEQLMKNQGYQAETQGLLNDAAVVGQMNRNTITKAEADFWSGDMSEWWKYLEKLGGSSALEILRKTVRGR